MGVAGSILRRRETGVKGISWDQIKGEGSVSIFFCHVGSEPWLCSDFFFYPSPCV